jgi:hypothetical protein
MGKKKKALSPATKKEQKSMITWIRLPKGVEIEARGPKSPELEKILKDAGLNPEARCFGGDTCIA